MEVRDGRHEYYASTPTRSAVLQYITEVVLETVTAKLTVMHYSTDSAVTEAVMTMSHYVRITAAHYRYCNYRIGDLIIYCNAAVMSAVICNLHRRSLQVL